jgi:hypothetical protein
VTMPLWRRQNSPGKSIEIFTMSVMRIRALLLLIVLPILLHQNADAFQVPTPQRIITQSVTIARSSVIQSVVSPQHQEANQDEVDNELEANSEHENDKSRRTLRLRHGNKASIGERAVTLYVGYARRLWKETSTEERKRLARENAVASIEKVHHLVDGVGLGGAYWDLTDEKDDDENKEAKQQM